LYFPLFFVFVHPQDFTAKGAKDAKDKKESKSKTQTSASLAALAAKDLFSA